MRSLHGLGRTHRLAPAIGKAPISVGGQVKIIYVELVEFAVSLVERNGNPEVIRCPDFCAPDVAVYTSGGRILRSIRLQIHRVTLTAIAHCYNMSTAHVHIRPCGIHLQNLCNQLALSCR
jgi:hypothetical protein